MLLSHRFGAAIALVVLCGVRSAAARAPRAEPSAYGRFTLDTRSCELSFSFASGKRVALFKPPLCGAEGSEEGVFEAVESIGALALPARGGQEEYHLFQIELPSAGNSGPAPSPYWAVVIRADAAWASAKPFYEGDGLQTAQLTAGAHAGLVLSEPPTTTERGTQITIRFGAASSVPIAVLPSKVVRRTRRTLNGQLIGGFHASNWRPVVRNGDNDVVIDEDGQCALPRDAAGEDFGPVRVLADEVSWDDGRTVLKCVSIQGYRPAPAAPPAPPPGPNVPGAPSAAECSRPAPKSGGPARTQLAITDQQGELANVEACKMRAAYTALDKSLSTKAVAAEKLLAAQSAWNAFLDGHDDERFPHMDEQGYYGSMLGMCIQMDHQAQYKARTAELRSMTPCKAGSAPLEKVQADVNAAERALRDAMTKILTRYNKDSKFVAALRKAEQAFERWRAAQAAYQSAASGGNASCGLRETERVTRARTKQLGVWLEPPREGDGCSGSYGSL